MTDVRTNIYTKLMKLRSILGVLVFLAGISFGMWASAELIYEESPKESLPTQTETLGVENYLAEGCEPPGGGCGADHYWDNNICDCVYSGSSSNSPTPASEVTPSPGESYEPTSYPTEEPDFSLTPYPTYEESYGGYPESNYTVDRLAQVDEATMNCIRTRLNDEEFQKLRYFVPFNSEEEKMLQEVFDKASICFESYSEIKNIEEASREIGEISSEVEACLRYEVGDTAFEEINGGLREPTEEEMRRGEKCFGEFDKSNIRYQTESNDLEEDIKSCLRLALGDTRFDEIKTGNDPTLEERDKIERCFGASPVPFQSRPEFELPVEIESCLKDAVGDERFNEINSGVSEPTEEERDKGEACFEKLNDTQASFLPAPPEQVPYLPSQPEIVAVVSINEKTEEVSPGVFGRVLVISGTGPPEALIDIYIYSEPIVVTTKTDANGDWVYEMSQPLEGEVHVAFATVRSGGGQLVRSEVFDFQVVAAPDVGQSFLPESESTGIISRFFTSAVGLVALGVVLVMGGIGFIYFKRVNLEKIKAESELLPGERDGKSEDTPGSVN